MALSQLTFVFRRPVFPVICAFGDRLESADSIRALALLLGEREFPADASTRMIDSAAEEWKFLGDMVSVAPRSPVRIWKKRDIVQLLKSSRNATELDRAYPEHRINSRTVQRIIVEVAALLAAPKGLTADDRGG